jgi:hypothetical protein
LDGAVPYLDQWDGQDVQSACNRVRKPVAEGGTSVRPQGGRRSRYIEIGSEYKCRRKLRKNKLM